MNIVCGDDSARMWIAAVPPAAPDELNIVLGLDTRGGPDERVACDLFGYGHEGEEGVFYLLPDDLRATVELTCSRLGVRLVTRPQRMAESLVEHGVEFRRSAADVANETIDGGQVTVLYREIDIDVDALAAYPGLLPGPDHRPAMTEDGEVVGGGLRPVLCLDHAGPATLPELLDSYRAGEGSIIVLGAD
ncbi:hypothetical protein ABZ783_00260 [Micromonospora sp. NPDC047738]|uniref:hypothetical protein n=1 Tax=Micromonospora sp. NPDC047738 TaxID=3155741 RepID=UPI0033D420CB